MGSVSFGFVLFCEPVNGIILMLLSPHGCLISTDLKEGHTQLSEVKESLPHFQRCPGRMTQTLWGRRSERLQACLRGRVMRGRERRVCQKAAATSRGHTGSKDFFTENSKHFLIPSGRRRLRGGLGRSSDLFKFKPPSGLKQQMKMGAQPSDQ